MRHLRLGSRMTDRDYTLFKGSELFEILRNNFHCSSCRWYGNRDEITLILKPGLSMNNKVLCPVCKSPVTMGMSGGDPRGLPDRNG